MTNKIKDIDIRNCTCYLFNNIINIENFSPNDTKIDQYAKIYSVFQKRKWIL